MGATATAGQSTNYTQGYGTTTQQRQKQQNLQMTYASAMPRLSSANAYLSKQTRKLKSGPGLVQPMKGSVQSSQSVKSSGRITRPTIGDHITQPILAHSSTTNKSKPIISEHLANRDGMQQTSGPRSVIFSGSQNTKTNNLNQKFTRAP